MHRLSRHFLSGFIFTTLFSIPVWVRSSSHCHGVSHGNNLQNAKRHLRERESGGETRDTPTMVEPPLPLSKTSTASPAVAVWICSFCTLENPTTKRRCQACERRRRVREEERQEPLNSTIKQQTVTTEAETDIEVTGTRKQQQRPRGLKRPRNSSTPKNDDDEEEEEENNKNNNDSLKSILVYLRVNKRRQAKPLEAIKEVCSSPRTQTSIDGSPRETHARPDPATTTTLTPPTITTITKATITTMGRRHTGIDSTPTIISKNQKEPTMTRTESRTTTTESFPLLSPPSSQGMFRYTPPTQEEEDREHQPHRTPIQAAADTASSKNRGRSFHTTILPVSTGSVTAHHQRRVSVATTKRTPVACQKSSLRHTGTTTTTKTTTRTPFLSNQALIPGIATMQKKSVVAATFQTAGRNQTIRVSEASLRKAETLLCQISNSEKQEYKSLSNTVPGLATMQKKSVVAATFQTAGRNQTIQVSEAGLRKAETLLYQDSTLEVRYDNKDPCDAIAAKRGPSNPLPTSITMQKTPSVAAFQTAGSNQTIRVSEASLRKAEIMLNQKSKFEDGINSKDSSNFIEATRDTPNALRSTATIQNTRVVAAFQTAGSNQTIQVSEASLRNAEKFLFQNKIFDRYSPKMKGDQKSCSIAKAETVQPTAKAAFETAGTGRRIRVSQDSLQKAEKLLFQETNSPYRLPKSLSGYTTKTKVDESGSTQAAEILHEKPVIVSFQTAGAGRTIQVSEASLKKAENLLSNATQFGAMIAKSREEELAASERVRASPGASLPRETDRLSSDGLRGGLSNTSGFAKTVPYTLDATNGDVSAEDNGNGSFTSTCIDNDSEVCSLALDPTNTPEVEEAFSTQKRSKDLAVLREQKSKKSHVNPVTPLPNVATPHHQLVRWGSIRRVTYGITPSTGISGHSSHKDEPKSPTVDIKPKGKKSNVATLNELGVTPQQATVRDKRAKVTRSIEGGSWHHRRLTIDGKNAMTPVPINFSNGDREEQSVQERGNTVSYADASLTSSVLSPQTFNEEGPIKLEKQAKCLEEAYQLGELSADPNECRLYGVDEVTLTVTSTNAMNVSFSRQTGLPVCLDFSSESSSDESIGSISDIKRDLIKQGCDPKLLTVPWISNHKRWIVWKYASYERSFSRFLGGKHLCYGNVVRNLRARFEKEIAKGQRPAIRKILNRDAAASRMMVLAVSKLFRSISPPEDSISDAIGQASPSYLKVELTDGWYSVQAGLDSKLSEFASDGLIKVGTKLLVSNAQLEGVDDGIDPLDDEYNPSKLSCKIGLRLSANSTRLGKWNAKLGFVQPNLKGSPKGMLLVQRVSDIVPGGGNIPLIRLLVLRRYPLLYYEKAKTGEGELDKPWRPSVLTEAEEDFRKMEFEKRMLKSVEKLTEALQREIEKVSRKIFFSNLDSIISTSYP